MLPPGSMEVMRLSKGEGCLNHASGNGTALPAGLRYCRRCGEVRGETPDAAVWLDPERGLAKSTCLCEGQICESCGRRRRRRPISNYYEPVTGDWWHVPWFMGLARKCSECRRLESGATR